MTLHEIYRLFRKLVASQINLRLNLHKKMVGTLYPSILHAEMMKLKKAEVDLCNALAVKSPSLASKKV